MSKIKSKIIFHTSVKADAVLGSLIEKLNTLGFDCRQSWFVSQDCYRNSKGLLPRLYLRISMYFLFPLWTACSVFFSRKEHLHVVTTNPFFNALLIKFLCNRHSKVIQLVWDLYPWAGSKSKAFHLLRGPIRSIVSKTFKTVDGNVFIGHKLHGFAKFSYSAINNPVVIPVGCSEMAINHPFLAHPYCDGLIHIVYCGNMGINHDYQTVCQFFANAEEELLRNYCFKFYSSGVNYQKLSNFINKLTINKFLPTALRPPLSDKDWVALMNKPFISLVTCDENSSGLLLPSKAFSSLYYGHPIIAITSYNSELAAMIRENDCGWVICPGDNKSLADLLEALNFDRVDIQNKSTNAKNTYFKQYSSDVISILWKNYIESIWVEPHLD